MPMRDLLTVKERSDIRKRAKGNKDVEALLAENDKLRSLLEKGSASNKFFQQQLDQERKDHRQTAQKLKKAQDALKKARK